MIGGEFERLKSRPKGMCVRDYVAEVGVKSLADFETGVKCWEHSEGYSDS